MELKGERQLPVDRAAVWAMLNDTEVLKSCVPGCESMSASGEHAYDVVMNASIGPVKARFKGKMSLTDIDPPHGYRLTFDQTGYLRVFNGGIARRLPAGLSLGLGLNYATGRLDRATVERSGNLLQTVTITDDKAETFQGFFVNAGLAWEATSRLTAGLAVRSPYVKKGTGRSLLHYEVPGAGTDIRIDAEAVNSYRQPWVLGAGVSYRHSASWSFAADAAFYGWSGYRVTYFDEPLERPFRDVLKAGAGVEYLAPATMFGESARIPFRLGLVVDPQPMSTVHSTYRALTFGTGLSLRSLAIDVSAFIGRERGSGDSLKTGKIVLSVRYVFQE